MEGKDKLEEKELNDQQLLGNGNEEEDMKRGSEVDEYEKNMETHM
jgi:hypothetical protein